MSCTTWLCKRLIWLPFLPLTVGLPALGYAGPITAGLFFEFGFTDVGILATGCDPADPAGPFCLESSGTPTTVLDAPPWTFTAPSSGATLTVTDAFTAGDQFRVFDFSQILGETSVPVGNGDCGDDPVSCLTDPNISKGSFFLAAGDHSITITPVLSLGGGSGYLQVAVPEPASLLLLALGLAGLGIGRTRRSSVAHPMHSSPVPAQAPGNAVDATERSAA